MILGDKVTENTVGGRIEKQDAEAFQLLQSLLNRPGMYVGEVRFDYIDFLFRGYCMGRKSKIDFLPSRELQYWLFHTQSASLHGSLSGATLFYRCFGLRDIAFENYKAFLNASLPADCEKVEHQLYAYEEAHKTVRYDWEDDIPADHYKKLAQSVYINIKEMLEKAGLFYDGIKIYIHKERLFNQVRFLFHGSNGWMTDSQIIIRPEYHEHLLAIHASTRNATVEGLRNCGYGVLDGGEYGDNILPSHDTFSDNITFFAEFNRWKDKQLTT
jgi:hypothetical protein